MMLKRASAKADVAPLSSVPGAGGVRAAHTVSFSSTRGNREMARTRVSNASKLDGPQTAGRREVLAVPLLWYAAALYASPAASASDVVSPAAIVEPGLAEIDAPSGTKAYMGEPAVPLSDEVTVPGANIKMKELYDKTLAYKFLYPVETASGKQLSMNITRKPEKYSSAAPLNADARQRIVSELMDLRNYVTVSMTVGPASGVLKGTDPSSWKPLDVALTVLIDRSTSRLSSGQRVALNDVEEARAEDRNGKHFFVYEHLSQTSPTPSNNRKETYRHALAVTTYRSALSGEPYLYTLNLSCRQELWDDLRPGFERAVNSFLLTETTKDYIPPDKDPWLFF